MLLLGRDHTIFTSLNFHFPSHRCNVGRYHWHGSPNIGYILRLHCGLLHIIRWLIFGSVHGCHTIVLHIYRPLDVYSVCVGKRTRKKFIVDGGRLDWFGWSKRALVLYRLWAVVDFRWYSVAGMFGFTPADACVYSHMVLKLFSN